MCWLFSRNEMIDICDAIMLRKHYGLMMLDNFCLYHTSLAVDTQPVLSSPKPSVGRHEQLFSIKYMPYFIHRQRTSRNFLARLLPFQCGKCNESYIHDVCHEYDCLGRSPIRTSASAAIIPNNLANVTDDPEWSVKDETT